MIKFLIKSWFINNSKKIKIINHNIILVKIFLHVIKKNKKWLLLNFNNYFIISEIKFNKLNDIVNNIIQGLPLEYILEKCMFCSLSLKIKHKMFIPRICTEIVVKTTLSLLQQTSKKKIILELGTGTGAISLTINKYCNNKHNIIAIDNDLISINCAKLNSYLLNVKNIKFLLIDWFNKIIYKKKFDLIISNPPYVSNNNYFYKNLGNHFESKNTTLSLYNGLNDLFHIIICSNKFLLKKGGYIILEHGWDQAIFITNFLKLNNFSDILTLKDNFYNDRITIGKKL